MCQTCRSLVFLELKQLYKQPLTFLIEKTYFSFPESFFFLSQTIRKTSTEIWLLFDINLHRFSSSIEK